MSWTCSNCSTKIDARFGACWKCGTDASGNPDPDFAAESDPEDLTEDPESPRIHCQNCGYQGKALFSTEKKSFADWLVAGLLSIAVSPKSWIHFCHLLCPKCGAGDQNHRPWSGEIQPENRELWMAANRLEELRNRKKRHLVYLVFGSLLLAGSVLWWSL